ncbi:MAG: hypothetical protein ACM3X0_14810 [Bacteroidota bacterium]
MHADLSGQPPVIHDLASGRACLAHLQLANPVLAERQLTDFVDALLHRPPEAGVLFALLEQARAPMAFVEEEMARRYHNKPLPLTDEEEVCFRKVLAGWRKMLQAYALCARPDGAALADPQQAGLTATLLHRGLYYTGNIILEHYRARRELPAGIWLELHCLYAAAEEQGLACTPVEDALENNLQATHCAAAYTAVLLIEIASPYSNSVRNLNLIRRWAGMWAPLVSIHAVDNDLEVPPYVVELTNDAPLHPTSVVDSPGNDARRLDTTRLGLQISHMLSQLRQRVAPSQLGLGEETGGHVAALLEHLSRPWTQLASPRRFRRFPTRGIARVAVGFEAMHYFVGGQEFEQPDSARAYSRREFDELFTFRERAGPGQALSIKPQTSFPVEEWSVINHSANGFRLARGRVGQRMAHAQLMAVCPHDGEQFLLVQVSWLMQEDNGGLVAGVAILPGIPVAVGVRQAGENHAANVHFGRAFLLPAVAAVHEDASLVLPAGLYQPSRTFDVVGAGNPQQLRLKHILQRGVDFDRISYDAL